MLSVIINADDFGANEEVNCAIEECIKKGLITSSTIMAGGKGFDEAVVIAKQHPEISFGVHLTLDEFYSLTEHPLLKEYGLIDDNGQFIKGAYRRISEYPEDLIDAISEEWIAQIRKVKAAGINVSHIDSHHHVHVCPKLKSVIARIMLAENIGRIRLNTLRTFGMYIHHVKPKPRKRKVSTVPCKERTKKNAFQIISDIVSLYVWNLWIKCKYTCTAFFCDYTFFLDNAGYFRKMFDNKTIELMCHPGHPDYQEETLSLSLLPDDVKKISYIDLR